VFQVPARSLLSADTLAGLGTDVLFDALAIRLDPTKAADHAFVINWRFTDRAETLALTLRHGTLTHRMNQASAQAVVSITTTRATLDSIILGKMRPADAVGSGALRIEGDATRLASWFGMLEPPTGMMFEILTPGEGR
jgi:alkyl sulfatase BDS1-like metallo-beta-lactamase superfamily hydrolase